MAAIPIFKRDLLLQIVYSYRPTVEAPEMLMGIGVSVFWGTEMRFGFLIMGAEYL